MSKVVIGEMRVKWHYICLNVQFPSNPYNQQTSGQQREKTCFGGLQQQRRRPACVFSLISAFFICLLERIIPNFLASLHS